MVETNESTQSLAVRAGEVGDAGPIKALAIINGMFAPDEVGWVDDALRRDRDGSSEDDIWLVAVGSDKGVLAAAYVAPEPFGDRVWNLYFLAVDPRHQRKGVATTLLIHVEQSLRAARDNVARVLIVETSSGEAYEGARSLYAQRGFIREAVVREFYGPGDDKVTFWKSLT